MSLAETISGFYEGLKQQKEHWVKNNPENTDQPNCVAVMRDGDLVATVITHPGKDDAMRAARFCAFAFSADVIILAFESLVSDLDENPVTGKPWDSGEMSVLAEHYPEAYEKGWIAECITTVARDRHDNWVFYSDSFTTKDGVLTWGKHIESFNGCDDAVYGVITDALGSFMSEGTLQEQIEKDLETNPFREAIRGAIPEDPEQAKVVQDFSAVRMISEHNIGVAVMLSAAEGSHRAKLVEERYNQEKESAQDKTVWVGKVDRSLDNSQD